ncbi:MsnO8 family LLM class oxidoreductase [Virgibacillus chiguensis]|uniref:Luciferase family oxidoreductase, group 1 n=1 Tax=Virgibacillus chiguensis TaxID=411959 RepID=A0A1M5S8N9_9BACI|nr:MsnO8 family LLM class oxidoreductase [Virgibacillus chiguensis]SHH34293.1 luciferase family oxidoreductase, group 1 [Virgibacillus chiguensis]
MNRLADKLGFSRYWVAEHHDMKRFACPAPDILLGLIGNRTEHIKIGAGAVLLPHYQSFNISERYNILATLYPQRIDVGIGRAPGGSAEAIIALSGDYLTKVKNIGTDIDELHHFFHQTFPKDHMYAKVSPTPIPDSSPNLWILGTSEKSAILAVEKGLPYVFGHFMTDKDGPTIVHQYQKRCHEKVIVAVSVICAKTFSEAKELAKSSYRANKEPAGDKKTRKDDVAKEERVLEKIKSEYIFGDPSQVHRRLQALQLAYKQMK